MKTNKEIEKMIGLVKRFRAVIPERDGFGGDNHGKYDAQIEELEKSLTSDECDMEDRFETIANLDPHGTNELLRARIESIDWVNGDIDDLFDEDEVKEWEKNKK